MSNETISNDMDTTDQENQAMYDLNKSSQNQALNELNESS